jgi:hypothetical protein
MVKGIAVLGASAVALLAIGAASAATATPDPKRMVLQLGDLPSGFSQERGRYVSNAQAARETKVKKNYARLGRINGYESDFTKHGAPLVGILQVTSAASNYKTAAGAHTSIRISELAAQRSKPRFRRLSVGTSLGDESRLLTVTLRQGGVTVDVYSLIWRSGRVYATILAGALSGTGSPAQIVALGKKQQKRILAATR